MYNYFWAWSQKIWVFVANSRQVVRTCPEEQSLKNSFLIKNEKLAIKRHLSLFSAKTSFGGCQTCHLIVQRSFFWNYFFCTILVFLKCFPSWSGNFSHCWRFLLAFFFKSHSKQSEVQFEVKWFFLIILVFILKILGFFRRYVPSKIQKSWSKLQSTFPAVHLKEIIFWKQIYKRQLGWKLRTFSQLFCQFFETSFHHYRRNSLRKIIFLRKPLLCIKFFGLEGWNFVFFGA